MRTHTESMTSFGLEVITLLTLKKSNFAFSERFSLSATHHPYVNSIMYLPKVDYLIFFYYLNKLILSTFAQTISTELSKSEQKT